ncbi:hypothetical protein ACF9IK_30150 [Kitasatospora hibisci]|uniref:hypothetical protein n=1 Tax=Kitasatospora hibisci TaxID=3369522 RepID=UPI003753F3BF
MRFEELAHKGPFDVMAEIAAPLALAVISDLLGVEQPDLHSFAEISDRIMRSMDAGLAPALAAPGQIGLFCSIRGSVRSA